MIIFLFNVLYTKGKHFLLGGNMSDKTLQFLTYIIKEYPRIPITSLMKLSYLADLVNIKKTKTKISDFEYIRYNFGPFDNKIYDYVGELIDKNMISQDSISSFVEDFFIYEINENIDEDCFSLLKQEEKETIEEVINSLRGLGAKALTKVAYKTKPMQKIKAEIDNTNGLGEKLDLFAA